MNKLKPFVGFRSICLCLFFLFLEGKILGQISDHSIPASFGFTTRSSVVIPRFRLDSVRVEQQKLMDSKMGIPNRYGVVQSVDIDIPEEGLKTRVGNMNVWRYEIECPDAVSLGIYFKTYDLPQDASVYIYSADKARVRGGFTSINNKKSGQLAIGEFKGTSLIIEYDEPVDAAFSGGLVVGSVVKAYTNLASKASTIDTSGWVEINCPAGQNWQTEKHAVCLITFHDSQYSYSCSGALVNNVREDGTPYFLTANHCLSSNTVAQTLVAYFNYENSTCNSSDASLDESLSGAALKATSSYSDFTLLELDETPPDAYDAYFAGWNASSDSPENGTCIHHPEGMYKCIAIDNDAPVSYSNRVQWDDGVITEANTHWEVSYDTGTDESGSSGSPLFNENKQIIGQLHGGNDEMSLFGMFSLSWNYSSTSTKQLKSWLDPDNTGTLRLEGIGDKNPPEAEFSSSLSIACLSTVVSFTDESTHSPTSWSWSVSPATFEYTNGTDSTSENPSVIFLKPGSYSVSLIATNKYGSDTVSYSDLVQAFDNLPVVLSGLSDELTLCGSELSSYEIDAEGADEYTFSVDDEDYFDITTSSNVLYLTLKDDVKPDGSFDTYVRVTGTDGNCSASDSVLLHVVMPKNDNVENAIALRLGKNAYYSNECGTVEDGEPYPSGTWSDLDNSIWFTFPGTSSGMVTIETKGFDTQIAVYQADSYSDILSGNYILMAASDDDAATGSTEAAIRNLKVNRAKTYWLQVDGNNGDYGNLQINLVSNTLEVYPNPSSGVYHFTVSSEESGTAQLAVFSITGKQVYSGTASFGPDSNTIDLDITGCPSGMYFFRAKINGSVMTKKLILTK